MATQNPGSVTAPRETVACRLCGSARCERLVEAADPLETEGETFAVVRCLACGLAYVRERPTPEAMARHYPEGYAPHEPPDEPAGGPWHGRLGAAVLCVDYGYPPQPPGVLARGLAWLGRRTLSRRDRQRWIPWREGGRLLDVGCGAGRYLLQMRALGWSVTGCDTAPHVATDLGRHGVTVHVGDLAALNLPEASFDAVTLWSALEHHHDPLATLRTARRLLAPGGRLAATVPNLGSWSFERFGARWFGLDLPRHLVHFTPATLRRIVADAGLRVDELTHVGRASWIKRSAAGTPFASRRAARRAARASERAERADSLRVLATRDDAG